jgi:hypothetical protein
MMNITMMITIGAQRDNPCHSSYYNGNRKIKKNIIASDIGLLVKRGDEGSTMVVVNDIKTATNHLSGVQFELYDYQLQLDRNSVQRCRWQGNNSKQPEAICGDG